MGHMARSLCAGTLATEGKIKKHNSNGTICAVLGDCVYMTCANQKDRITGLGCGKFPVVNKHSISPMEEKEDDPEPPITMFRKSCIHWVMVTEKNWKAVFDTARGMHTTKRANVYSTLPTNATPRAVDEEGVTKMVITDTTP